MLINAKQAADMLKAADNILILTHAKPDGDTLGSAFALLFALIQLGKTARVECADEIPARYRFICPDYTPAEFEPDFVVSVDVADVFLLGTLVKVYKDKIDLSIDHHKSNTMYAANTLLDAGAAAAGEVVLRVIDALGAEISEDIANAIFTALTCDTGAFRFANTSAFTHRAAARMIECGAAHCEINRAMFETKSRERLALERLALESLRFELGGMFASITISHDIKERLNVKEEDFDGISAMPRTIDGVFAGVTLRESDKGGVRISMRTKNPVDASRICMAFGGGGHPNAAGATVNAPPEKVYARVLEQVRLELIRNDMWPANIRADGSEIPPKGIIVIDKPQNFTSHDVVAKLRGILKMKKIGHAGTLDPMVTGVLPIFLGRAAKAADMLPDKRKRYTATFKLGITTDTQDITGRVLRECEVTATPDEVKAAILSKCGKIQQIPPMYSAVSVDGTRLYKLARQGVEIERAAKEVIIEDISIIHANHESHEYTIDVLCSTGTYIRTLCHDIGEQIGCGAVMTKLRRTMAAGFTLEGALTLEQVSQMKEDGTLKERIIDVGEMFSHLPRFELCGKQERMFLDGGIFEIEGANGQIAVWSEQHGFLGIATANPKGRVSKRKLFVVKDANGNV